MAQSAKAEVSLALFPNPAHADMVTLTVAAPGTVVTVFDALGRLMTSAPADAAGTATLALPVGLPTDTCGVRGQQRLAPDGGVGQRLRL